MEAVIEKNEINLKTDERFERLFPSDDELDLRLVNVMRTPVHACIDKEELLNRLKLSAHV